MIVIESRLALSLVNCTWNGSARTAVFEHDVCVVQGNSEQCNYIHHHSYIIMHIVIGYLDGSQRDLPTGIVVTEGPHTQPPIM